MEHGQDLVTGAEFVRVDGINLNYNIQSKEKEMQTRLKIKIILSLTLLLPILGCSSDHASEKPSTVEMFIPGMIPEGKKDIYMLTHDESLTAEQKKAYENEYRQILTHLMNTESYFKPSVDWKEADQVAVQTYNTFNESVFLYQIQNELSYKVVKNMLADNNWDDSKYSRLEYHLSVLKECSQPDLDLISTALNKLGSKLSKEKHDEILSASQLTAGKYLETVKCDDCLKAMESESKKLTLDKQQEVITKIMVAKRELSEK